MMLLIITFSLNSTPPLNLNHSLENLDIMQSLMHFMLLITMIEYKSNNILGKSFLI